MTPLESAWERVHREAARLRPIHLRTLFADDPARFRRFSFVFEDLSIDVSREKLDAAALDALLALARAVDVEGRREAMFAGRTGQPDRGSDGAPHGVARWLGGSAGR